MLEFLRTLLKNITSIFTIVLGFVTVVLFKRTMNLNQKNKELIKTLDENEKITKLNKKIVKVISKADDSNLTDNINRMRRNDL